MDPRRSFAASGTTYHSFHDIELREPPSPPRSRGIDSETTTAPRRDGPGAPAAVKMQRQDSGYESHVSRSARNSTSLHTRPAPPSRRTSNASSSAAGAATTTTTTTATTTTTTCRALRARPSTRRSAKSYPQPTVQSLYARSTGTGTGTNAPPAVYFQFPTPDLVELTETPARPQTSSPAAAHSPSPPSPPPPTTHYWTSDSTRRLEYAAIDAASRGVKGWIRRHLVPDCFHPRHVAFDDDSGSVRRYRLELEDEDDEKRQRQPGNDQRRRGWSLFSLRKSTTL